MTKPKVVLGGRGSIRGKLALLVLASVGASVVLIAGVSGVRDARRDAALQADRLSSAAAVVASLSAEGAYAGDRQKVFSALRSISLMRDVKYARVERADGRLLAETGSGVRLLRDAKVSSGAPSILSLMRSSTIQTTAPVIYAKRPVGRVVLVGDAGAGAADLLASLIVSFGAALLAAGVGLAIAWRMQRRISDPIVDLTAAMAQVQASHDYGQLADIRHGNDEIGQLVDGFNRMLVQIRDRDAALASHAAGLERTVAERTADLVQARDAADAANSAKSDFLATMSHEIRTPMNGIMVMAEMLAAGELPKRQRRFAEVIAKSGSSLLSIINDILDFSKIEAGKMELERTPVDLAEVAEDVSALFWERARSKGLDLAAYVDPAVPALIAADPVRLRQVIGNLVNNAIKFTEAGGVLIRVDARDGWVRIGVHDTGIGIAQDKLGSVFGAFSQADQSTTRKFGGTGLGLAICKRLAEAMGGQVSVASKLGHGSVFSLQIPVEVVEPAQPWPDLDGVAIGVDLPGPSTANAVNLYLRAAKARPATVEAKVAARIARPEVLRAAQPNAGPAICIAEYGDAAPQALRRAGQADAVLVQPFRRRDLVALLAQLAAGQPLVDHADSAEAADAGAALPAFAGACVLVADDSAVNREVAIEALSRLGVQCEVVNDGRQAVEAVLARPFDLVLMDGSMPELDGYDASREIRRLQGEAGAARTPIVALTAHVLGAAAEAWREADMDAVLHKPFTLKALAKVLAQFLAASEPQAKVAQAAPPATAPAPARPTAVAASDLFDAETVGELARLAADGKADFVARVRSLYRENAPPAARKVIDAASADDAAAAALAAHALKSMSLNIGARAVAEQAAWIEGEARDHGRIRVGDAQTLNEKLLATLDALGGAAAAGAAVDPDAQLMEDLRGAAERGELHLEYQPQIARDGVTLAGVEALLRWRHPAHGLVSPARFIPLAERHGLIRPITRWVIDQAMRETADRAPLQVSINASALEVADPDFAGEVEVMIARHRYDPQRLEIEVTETAILSDAAEVRRNMERLHELKVKIALDDFGVGYSSLSHLRLFPFDKLKIDQAFIQACSTDVESATLVHAVISIGRALGMKVVAEGVENEAQQKFLRNAGVHAFQGFLFGRSESAQALARRWAAQQPSAPRRAAS